MLLSRSSLKLKFSLVFFLTLFLVIVALLIGVQSLKTRQLRNEAMAVAEQVVAFRAWVANTGVVWVDHLAPEFRDYLSRRASGDKTLEFFSKNPALATRELSDIVSKTATRATFRVTSDEYRNPANAPDGFETSAIQLFKDNKDAKQAYREAFEGGQYRYMRAIPTMPMCLACHGENVAPEVMAAIRAHYPADQATGFASGQLRGAFSIRWEEAALARAIKGGEGAQRGLHP